MRRRRRLWSTFQVDRGTPNRSCCFNYRCLRRYNTSRAFLQKEKKKKKQSPGNTVYIVHRVCFQRIFFTGWQDIRTRPRIKCVFAPPSVKKKKKWLDPLQISIIARANPTRPVCRTETNTSQVKQFISEHFKPNYICIARK